MAWFGFAPTGEMVQIDPDGLTVPKWDLVDPEQRARANADPNGYLRNLNAAVPKLSWSKAKALYR